jgi:hypothetical protein
MILARILFGPMKINIHHIRGMVAKKEGVVLYNILLVLR